LGASKNTKIDVRIITATNADLHEKIKEGKFREDLYYRLNTIPIHIPPLRERREEILSIAEAALERYCTQYGFEKKSFTTSARNALENYNWPGNIRELISVVERSAILSNSESIDTEDLFLEARGLGRI
jgi:DNA-binding NtrC family response regulator